MAAPAVAGTGVAAPVPATRARAARYLHPLAWWAWAVGLMVAATRTTNPVILGLILGCLSLVVAARRPLAPWAGAYTAALRLGLVVLIARTVLQVVLGAPVGVTTAVRLPELPLPTWMAGIRVGGLVTWESVVIGLCEGLRLATIIACVGAANSLAAPSRLLRSVPAALYEVGVAVVVALTFAPHLLQDARRIRAARRLRGHQDGRIAGFARAAGPVLDGGLERSIQLAAAMDSRGYGRSGDLGPAQRAQQAALLLGGLVGMLVGLYGLFDSAAPRWLGWPLLAAGAAAAALGMRAAGRRSARTTYRPDPWRAPEWLTSLTGVLVAGCFVAVAAPEHLAMPTVPLGVPVVTPVILACLLLSTGPAWWTPPVPATGGVV